MSSPSSLILLTLLGCKSCLFFNPPSNTEDPPDPEDTDEEEDTADTGDTAIDTGPPPPCDVPEAEPNGNDWSLAQDLPMEQWACGVLLEQGDFDNFRFTTAGPGWVKVWASGDALNTFADLQFTFKSASDDYYTIVTASAESSDPILVFPADQAETFYVSIADQSYGYGEDNIWELMASSAKAPLVWDLEETETNNSQVTANPLESGDRVFGLIGAGSDYDWYSLELTNDKTDVTVRIYAWNYGSSLDSSVQLWSPSKTTGAIKTSHIGEHNYDLDPILTYSAAEGGTWTIKVDTANGGGETYWYVMEVEAVIQ